MQKVIISHRFDRDFILSQPDFYGTEPACRFAGGIAEQGGIRRQLELAKANRVIDLGLSGGCKQHARGHEFCGTDTFLQQRLRRNLNTAPVFQ